MYCHVFIYPFPSGSKIEPIYGNFSEIETTPAGSEKIATYKCKVTQVICKLKIASWRLLSCKYL